MQKVKINIKGKDIIIIDKIDLHTLFASTFSKMFILWGWMCYLVGKFLWNKLTPLDEIWF